MNITSHHGSPDLLSWFRLGWICAYRGEMPVLSCRCKQCRIEINRMYIEYDLHVGFTSYIQYEHDRKHSHLK